MTGLLLWVLASPAQAEGLTWPEELDIGIHLTAMGIAAELMVDLDHRVVGDMGVRVGASTGLDAWEGDALYVGYGALTANFRNDKIVQFEGHGGPSMSIKDTGLFFGWRAGAAMVLNTGDHSALRFGMSGSVPLVEVLPNLQVASGESNIAFIPEAGVTFRW